MKKCSQSHHHALAELNITPLLDLAFVLLVIFIITTTPVAADRGVELPSAAKRQKDPPTQVQYVTVEQDGSLWWNSMPVRDLALLQDELLKMRDKEPDINVMIRGAAHTKYRNVLNVMDVLQQSAVLKVNLATEAAPDGP